MTDSEVTHTSTPRISISSSISCSSTPPLTVVEMPFAGRYPPSASLERIVADVRSLVWRLRVADGE